MWSIPDTSLSHVCPKRGLKRKLREILKEREVGLQNE